MLYTEEMTTSEILLRLASMRNELLQAVDDIEKISKNICYKAEQTEPQTTSTPYKIDTSNICKIEPQTDCPKTYPSIDICTKDDMNCPWKKG